MTAREWVSIQKIFCDRAGTEVILLEERIYPDDILPDAGAPYRVHQQRCSHWLECNLAGHPCCWSGINPGYDPFKDARDQSR
ncbi:MAG TPA: hypothetical protein VMN57_14220 [Anaerolineales bacterium]|nr:hypothetical protein [Anaerolineales bacterium]